jgi:hypothetical protein
MRVGNARSLANELLEILRMGVGDGEAGEEARQEAGEKAEKQACAALR